MIFTVGFNFFTTILEKISFEHVRNKVNIKEKFFFIIKHKPLILILHI